MSPKDMRRSYDAAPLRGADLDPNPIVQFQRWFDEAEAALQELPEPYQHPNVATLATADADGRPAARIVLLKGVDDEGFVFFTDRESRKGRELAVNPHASLAFHWAIQERQVRVDGSVSRTTREEDERYFSGRPRGSQLSAAASHQTQPIDGRDALEAARESLAADTGAGPVATPPRWGGYRVKPVRIEFWQGQPDRLHDRFVYIPAADGWTMQRVQP